MDFGIYAGDTSKTIYVFLQDSTTGLAKTGIAYNSSGAIASYNLPLAARSAITLATQTVTGAWSSGGFVEVDATNEPGIYRFDVPNAAIASGAFTIITLAFTGVKTCAVMLPLHVRKANVTQLHGTAWLAPAVAGTPDVALIDGAITGPKLAANSGLKPLYVGAVTSGSATTYVMSGVTAANDNINGYRLRITSGAMVGQCRMIKDWISGTSTLELDVAFTTSLSAADTFVIEPAQVNVKHIADVIAGGVTTLEVDIVKLMGDTQSATDLKDFVDAGYDPSTNKVQGVVLVDTVTTYTGNTPQTGDAFARLGLNGSGLTALATAAQVSSLQVNTRANIQVPIEIEIPDASTQVWKIRLFLFDADGNMEAPDSTPTIALTNAAGTDRSSRLSSATTLSTGAYSWDYTATAGDAEEQLVWVFTVVEGGLTRIYPATSYVVEETAYRFSSTDRSTLNAAATATALAAVSTKLGTPAGASVSSDIAAAKLLIDSMSLEVGQLSTDWADGGRLDLLLDSALAAALLARQILGNKHTVTANSPSAGLYTILVRNDDDSATVRTIVYNPVTGARTVS